MHEPLRTRLNRSLAALGLAALAGCHDTRQVNVDMVLFRGACADARCADVVRGSGVIFESDGDDRGGSGSRLYAEAVTSSRSTVLLELAYRGADVWNVRFREIQRGRVAYRGRIERRSFDPVLAGDGRLTGWTFEVDTVDARTEGDPSPPIRIRSGRIEILGRPSMEDVARDNGTVEIQGGCGGVIDLGPYVPPDDFDDPIDPGPAPDPDPPPPPDPNPDPDPPIFDDDDASGCSGDTIEEDSGGGCAGDEPSDDESTGCGGDEYDEDDESTGCGGDEYDEDDDSTGCSGEDDSESTGCAGDDTDADSDSGCEGDEAVGSIALWRATRGTFRLAWPMGLVAWVNRRMRRRRASSPGC